MHKTFKLNRVCSYTECGKRVSDQNKSGFCNKHRDRTGKNNPFYGKHHTEKTIETAKPKCREASLELWENPDYRKKIIKGVSKPRREGFKKEQSDRITKWYKDNPGQKTTRRIAMIKSWKDGKITKSGGPHCNSSKAEREVFNELEKIFPMIEKTTIKIGKRWFYPDIITLKDKVIIEFYGDMWHANPKFYKAEDMIHHGKTAKEIWSKDKERIKILESEGYKVVVIWGSEWQLNKNAILNKLDVLLNWEGCLL